MLPASTAWNWARVLSRCTGARHQFKSSNLPANLQKNSLDSQALAAFGATGSDHCAAATGFHARQETVGTGALDFGRLVCAFHDKSYWPYRACYWAVSCEASFGDSNDLEQLYETTASLASLSNRQHICSTLTGEFWTKSHTKLRRQPQAATNRENP